MVLRRLSLGHTGAEGLPSLVMAWCGSCIATLLQCADSSAYGLAPCSSCVCGDCICLSPFQVKRSTPNAHKETQAQDGEGYTPTKWPC